jgi:hypothetical protein
MLSFRGLYLPAYRQMEPSGPQRHGGARRVCERPAQPEGRESSWHESRLPWALIGPLFGMALVIAAQEARWLDEADRRVRPLAA